MPIRSTWQATSRIARSTLLLASLGLVPWAAGAQQGSTAPADGKKKGASAAPAVPQAESPPQVRPDLPETKTDVSPRIKESSQFLEGLGRTPAEEKLLEEISRALQTYEAESKEFKREVQLLVEKKYDEKRSTLSGSYERAIRDLEVIERKERLDAIAQFEEFLQRYPDD